MVTGSTFSTSSISIDTFQGSFGTAVTSSALPHARVTILFELGSGTTSLDGARVRASLAGLQSKPTPFEQLGLIDCVELRLSPSAALASGLPLIDLNDHVEPADVLFGRKVDGLAAQLAETEAADRPALLRDIIRSHAARRPQSSAHAALCALEHANTGTAIADVADTIGGSRSALWRQITAAVGMSPRQYLMPRRFEHCATLLAADVSIAEASARAGYFDQSHFHRQAKRFTGRTPAQLAQRTNATYVQDGDSRQRQ